MRQASLRWLAALCTVGPVGGASAQALLVPDSTAIACMTPAPELRPKIVYPAEVFERREGGTVTVEMDFDAPDRPPRYSIDREFGAKGRAFAAAIHDHVMALRVPCLKEPVRMKQDFVFVPNDGRKVTWTHARQQAPASADADIWACLTGPVRRPLMLQERQWGGLARSGVLLGLTFTAPDQPPEVRVIVPSPASALTDEAVERARTQRLPCADGSRPHRGDQLFVLARTDAPKPVLRDLALVDFLRAVREPARVPVYFDFSTLACPFEVRLRLYQPYRRNDVGEVGTPHPDRRPFLDWLAGLALDLKPRELSAVLGQDITIPVPCGTLDL